MKGRRLAPPRFALAKNRGGRRIASMVASGTHTAAFRAGVSPGSKGLRNLRERAEAIGGRAEIHTAPGEGTRVRITVPH